LSGPIGLAIDSQGNIYAANNDNLTIEKFTPQGVGSVFASTGSYGAYGLAMDSADNLYAAIYSGNQILKFAPDGTSSVFANTASGPGYIAFVPEPSSWAILTLAIGARLTLRQRRRTAI